jgi:hypothetical protein
VQSRKKVSLVCNGRKFHKNSRHIEDYEAYPFDAHNLQILPVSKTNRQYKSAIHRGIHWTLTAEFLDSVWLRQSGLCALSGIPMVKDYGKHSFSIDRIDSGLPYEPSNIQLLVKEVNFMKQALNQCEFREMCKLIAQRIA